MGAGGGGIRKWVRGERGGLGKKEGGGLKRDFYQVVSMDFSDSVGSTELKPVLPVEERQRFVVDKMT